MKNCSFNKGCMKSVSFSCKCTSSNLHFCDDHFINHIKTTDEHVPECLVFEFSPEQKKGWIPKLQHMNKYFKSCRKRILNDAKLLMKCIETETKKALSIIKELEKASIDLILEKCFSKEHYKRLQAITADNINYISDEFEICKKSIENVYESYNDERIWKECDQLIFSRDGSGRMLAINLETFKLSSLEYAPSIPLYSHACKVDKNTFFFHCGSLNNSVTGDDYLINTKDKTYEVLLSSQNKVHGGGLAMKNNKVYIFGGWNGTDKNACETFDLKTKKCKSITALPKYSPNVTAAVLGEVIIVSGYELNSFYSYDDCNFNIIFKVPAH